MINFIVGEDEQIFQKEIRNQISDFMMNLEVDYKIHMFSCYDKEFEKAVKSDMEFKVYFLDIKTPCGSGIDAARYIREEVDDWNSLIVIVTSFSEYRYEALSGRLNLVDFVNKLDRWDKNMRAVLDIILKKYGGNRKCLKFEHDFVVNKVEYANILYIEREQNSKKSIVHATYGDFKIPKSLTELEGILDNRFYRSHRSLLVNLDRIEQYYIKTNTMVFDNNEECDFVSRDKKKELLGRVTNVD